MTEAEDIYKTLFCWFFFSLIGMQSQKTEYFIAPLEGKGEDTSSSGQFHAQASWRYLLCWLLSSPHPSSCLLYDICHFSYLKNTCSPFAPKVLYIPVGPATLVVPAVQWTTRDSAHIGCPEGSDKCSLQSGVWTVHLVQGN